MIRIIITEFLVVAFCLVLPLKADAQFANSGVSLALTYDSGVNWVDIDGDGDLDLAISGYTPFISNGQGKLYLNNSNVISFLKDIRTIEIGDQKWTDINHDGRPELIYAGNAIIDSTAGIDVFDGSYNYSGFPAGFTPLTQASIDWGDYDNDGDYDILISGSNSAGIIGTYLYANNRTSFSLVKTTLPGIVSGKVGFIDYDLDQDLDIFITGRDINGNKYTRLWRNTGGSFTVTPDLFVNLEYSTFDWGDINGDGYPDLLLGGYDNTARRGYLFINNAGNGFSLSGVKVPQLQQGSFAFGDADNDGDLDIFASGYKAPATFSNKFIFLNNATSFDPMAFTSDSVSKGYVNFGDYDNDNDLDVVFNGKKTNGNGLTVLANNLASTPNQKPSVPSNLTAVIEGTTVRLKWAHSTDNNTPRKSITYNIYVGTSSKGINIVAPNADVNTGFRRIARQGYIQDTIWTLRNMPVGTYYWGVQAIDNSLGASAFSAEGSFQIKDRFTKVTSAESPSVSSPAVYFDCDHDGDLDLFLNGYSALTAVENKLTPFTQANYRTIMANGYNPITTLSPNDYDNDNTIDFSISGKYNITGQLDSTIALYGYNSPFSYSIINPALIKDIKFEFAIWADFNNDGKQDLLAAGKTTNLGAGNIPVTILLKNLGNGVFQKMTHTIRGFESCGAVAGDFDNDMDIDILIYGKDQSGVPNTYLYVNQGDLTFTENLIANNQLFKNNIRFGTVAGDFDLDGQLDVYLGGVTTSNDTYARVLLNKNLSFSDANLQIRSSGNMSNFWADYDYDGDLDIYSVSSYLSPDKVRLYINNGGIPDEKIIDLGAQHKMDLPFMAVNLDNKNGLDFVMKVNGGDYNQFYDNWGSNLRPASSAPTNLSFLQDKLDIILKWDRVGGCKGCTYNIRVGTTTGGVDIVSPMSDPGTGYRYVVLPGNSYLNNGWKLVGLPVGNYYWAVQVVDPSNSGGPWSTVSSFTVSMINPDFSFTTECKGNATTFTDLTVATGTVTKWKWDFGDGVKSTVQNPVHLYASAGTFNVGLWAFTQSGDSAFKSYPVTVKALPVVDFTSNIACQGTATTFVNNTNVNGLTVNGWLWNFGDGATSGVQNPGTHGYLNPGDYQATLVATADNGCSDLKTKTVTVSAYPVAVITADRPLTFCKGDSVSLSVPYDSKYTYSWMAGGISITGGNSVKYVARLTGSYSVSVINTIGNCLSTSTAVNVTSNELPIAPVIIAGGPLSFCQGDSVILSVTNTSGYSYRWKLNGGAVGINSNQHTARESGIYSLTVTNSSGCSVDATNSLAVTIYSKPSIPTISINGSTTFCTGGSVELSVVYNPSLTYQWERDGSAITGAISSTFTVQTSGAYTLKITNSSGCFIRSQAVNVTVLTAPASPVITVNGQTQFCQGDSVELSITSIPGYDYNWKRDGGSTGTNSNRIWADISGVYNIIVSNTAGCVVASSNTVTIVTITQPSPSTVSLSGPASFCSGGNVTMSVIPTTGYSYSWKNENGFIAGASGTSYTATISGSYQLRITNTSGCSIFTPTVNVSVNPLPVKPLVQADNYSEGGCLGETPIKLHVDQVINGYSYQWYRNGKTLSGETKSYLEGFLQEGDYTVEAILNGCKALSDGQNLKFEDAPPKPYIYAIGDKMWYLVCSDSSALQYKWYYNDNLIQGATDYIYIANKKLGKYYVSIANGKGCFTFSDTVTIPLGSTNLNDLDPFEGMKIYPNPTTGIITIEMENQLTGDLLVSVIAGNGQAIIKRKFEKTTVHSIISLDLSGNSKGIYFINLQLDKFSEVRRIVLQ